MKKRSTIRVVLFAFFVVLLIGGGVILLHSAGVLFVKELVQDVEVAPAAQQPSAQKQVEAPSFTLRDVSGAEILLADLYGKPAVVAFWTTWNVPSADQMRILDALLAERGEDLFRIITIDSQEDPSVVEQFVRRGGYRVAILLDESGATTEAYGAHVLPSTYFIDRDGIIRDRAVGVLSGPMIIQRMEALLR